MADSPLRIEMFYLLEPYLGTFKSYSGADNANFCCATSFAALPVLPPAPSLLVAPHFS